MTRTLQDYNYNPADVKTNDYSPIPNGIYDVEVESFEFVDYTKNGLKTRIEFVLKILGGDFDGRKIYDYKPWLAGVSEKGIEMGQRQLKSLFGAATGNENEMNPDMLLEKPFKLKLVQKGENDNGHMEYNLYPQKPKGIQQAPAQATAQAQQPTPTANGNTPSWGAPTAQDGNTSGL